MPTSNCQSDETIDQVGEVGRANPGHLGGHEDFREDRQKEDRLDQDHHGDRAGQDAAAMMNQKR